MARLFAAKLEECPEGGMAGVRLLGREIVLVNDAGTIHALDGLCPHHNAPLAHGNLCEGRIVCPWHAWEFHVATGEFDYYRAIRLNKYPVDVEDGEIFVDMPDA